MRKLPYLISVTLISVNVHAWPQYHLDRIGISSNPYNEITGLNNHGDVVVYSGDESWNGTESYVRKSSGQVDLMPRASGYWASYQGAISDNGMVSGAATGLNWSISPTGTIYSQTTGNVTLSRFDQFNRPAYYPISLNNHGTIVGYAEDYDTGGGGACVWNHPTLPDGYLMSGGEATDINDAGIIVGSGGGSRPTYWDTSGQVHVLPMAAGCTNGYVGSINESGWMVGRASRRISSNNFVSYLQVWDPTGNLAYSLQSGTDELSGIQTPSWFYGAFINANNDVAFFDVINGVGKVRLWNSNTGLQELNPLITNLDGFTFDSVTGLNDRGQIIGQVYKPGVGRYYNILLTPVPEPGTLAVLALGVAGLLKRRKS